MSVTVRELIGMLDKKYHIRSEAGEAGLTHTVRWIYTVEDFSFDNMIHGNELVFTTGIAHRDSTEWLDSFIDALTERRSAGLVINVGPYITEIPKYLIEKCDKIGFPLFSIPWEISLIDVMYDCSHYLMKSEENSMSLTKALRSIILNRHSTPSQLRYIESSSFYSSHPGSLSRYCVLTLASYDDAEPAQALTNKTEGILLREGRRYSLFTLQNLLVCVLIVSGPEDGVHSAERIYTELAESSAGVSIGVSEPLREIDDLATACDQSVVAVRTAQKNGTGVMKYSGTGIFKLLYAISGPDVAHSYITEVLGKIKEYDRSHGSDYLETLRRYMENSGGVQKTADDIGTHRNTINNKIRQIRERFGLSFDYECITSLTIAFILDELYN